MVSNKFPFLSQLSNNIELGDSKKFLTADENGVKFVTSDGENCSFETGDLTVNGNLNVTTGHVSKFDVGTAIFKDKTLELGSSDVIVQGQANGCGIIAVNALKTLSSTKSGLGTKTVTLTMTSEVLNDSRQIVFVFDSATITEDIADCSDYKSLAKKLNKDTAFQQYATATSNSNNIVFECQVNLNNINVSGYDGPSILYDTNKSGWVLNKDVVLTKSGIETLGNAEDFNFRIGQGSTLLVPEGYDDNIVDNSLITKTYLESHTSNNTIPTLGFPYRGLNVYQMAVHCDLTQNAMSGINLGRNWTVVCPWFYLNLSTEEGQDATGYSGTYFKHNAGLFIFRSDSNSISLTQEGPHYCIRVNDTITSIDSLEPDTKGWHQIVLSSQYGVITLYDNGVEKGSATAFNLVNYQNVWVNRGYELTQGVNYNTMYSGNIVGEFVVLNYGLDSEELSNRFYSQIWVNAVEQSADFGTSSFPLLAGKLYNIDYVAGDDVSMCGMTNSSGTQLCRITATPSVSNGTVITQNGAVLDLQFTRQIGQYNSLDLSHGRNGVFDGNGVAAYNDTTPHNVDILEYIE